jgi:CubicO group peptidase (beta-lactamase class C family)
MWQRIAACAGVIMAAASWAADEGDSALAQLKARIEAGAIPGIHSVLAIADGKTVAEWYFDGVDETVGPMGPIDLGRVAFTPETLHDVRSVTKSVVSILFGIAYSEGAIKSLDTPVLDYFPEFASLHTSDRMKVRIRDVLTMTSGLHWDERTYPYSDVRNSEIAMEIADDPYRYVLSGSINAPPGTRFNYSGGDVAVVAAIVSRATTTPIDAYAREKLFTPLGIARFEWTRSGADIPRAASGLRLTTHDMAKIGTLMLDGGRWDGKQIVPESWVKAATTPHVDVTSDVEGDAECGTKFGYLWWIDAGCATTPRAPWFAAIGNGGQRIWVIPSRKLVVASTGGLYNDPKQAAPPLEVLTGILGGVPAH